MRKIFSLALLMMVTITLFASPVQRVTLLAHNAQNVANSTLIAFTSDATDNYDRLWDARKYKGNPTVSLYSKVGSMDAAINAMGELSTNKVVALGIDVSTTGTHTIMIDQLENVDATTGIYLQDMQTGAMHNLRNSGYSFQAQAGSITNRFYAHFQPMVTSVKEVQDNFYFYFYNNTLVIKSENNTEKIKQIDIFDINGRLVERKFNHDESNNIERVVDFNSGIYIIQITLFDNRVYQRKVFKN